MFFFAFVFIWFLVFEEFINVVFAVGYKCVFWLTLHYANPLTQREPSTLLFQSRTSACVRVLAHWYANPCRELIKLVRRRRSALAKSDNNYLRSPMSTIPLSDTTRSVFKIMTVHVR